MRPASLCSALIVFFANAGNAHAVDYCPLQLQGQYGNNYYYYCQTVQNGNCTYKYATVGTAYQCGGCCDNCCGDPCVNGFTLNAEEKPEKDAKQARPLAPSANDSEVVPARKLDDASDKGEGFATADERFCSASNTIVPAEVWVHIIDSMGKPHFFRCFDVSDPKWPGENLRVGRQVRPTTWANVPASATVRAADRDNTWPRGTTRFHRVTINDPMAAADDHRVFYLISVDDIE